MRRPISTRVPCFNGTTFRPSRTHSPPVHGDDLPRYKAGPVFNKESCDVGDIFRESDTAKGRAGNGAVARGVIKVPIIGVSVAPGLTALTRIPHLPSDRANDRVNPRIAAFELI